MSACCIERGKNLALLPLRTTRQSGALAYYIIKGSLETVGAIATLGLNSKVNGLLWEDFTEVAKYGPGTLFENIVKVVNPKAAITLFENTPFYKPLQDYIFRGFDASEKQARSKSCFNRQITSRLTLLGTMIACVVVRAVETAFGAVAIVFALLTCGQFEMINGLAFHGLNASVKLIRDISGLTIKFINPQAHI